eukprot:7222146-Prymnesium_polylepis.1
MHALTPVSRSRQVLPPGYVCGVYVSHAKPGGGAERRSTWSTGALGPLVHVLLFGVVCVCVSRLTWGRCRVSILPGSTGIVRSRQKCFTEA